MFYPWGLLFSLKNGGNPHNSDADYGWKRLSIDRAHYQNTRFGSTLVLRRLLLKLNKKRAILLEKKMLKVKLSKVPLTAEDIVEYDRVKENWTLTRDIIGTPGAGLESSVLFCVSTNTLRFCSAIFSSRPLRWRIYSSTVCCSLPGSSLPEHECKYSIDRPHSSCMAAWPPVATLSKRSLISLFAAAAATAALTRCEINAFGSLKRTVAVLGRNALNLTLTLSAVNLCKYCLIWRSIGSTSAKMNVSLENSPSTALASVPPLVTETPVAPVARDDIRINNNNNLHSAIATDNDVWCTLQES
jgi:hypothetical protein